MMAHWHSRRSREQFMRWKLKAQKVTCLLDVNEDGPLVEEVLAQQMRFKNM